MSTATRREALMQKIPVGPMRELLPVGPAYPLVGPNQATIRHTIQAPAATVFRFLEDAAVWKEFLDIDVEWTTPEPRGVGTTRTITANNQQVDETFLVWERGRRMVFRFDRCTLPLRAFAEAWAVTDADDGSCELAWSVAFDWIGTGGRAGANAFRAVFVVSGRRELAKLAAIVEADPDRFADVGGAS